MAEIVSPRSCRPIELLDLARCPIQNLAHFAQALRVPHVPRGGCVRRPAKALERAVHFHHRLVEKAFDEASHALEDAVDRLAVLLEVLTAGVGNLVDLPATFLERRS